MIKLALAGIIAIIIIFALILIIRNKPDFWFWIFLNLYFDPGGYVYGFLGGTLLGPLNISDVFISGIVICIIYARINWQVVFQDKFLKQFLLFLFLFGLYYYIIYGGVVPYIKKDFDYPTFLIKNRYFAYGFIILISVYVFSLRSLYYFYTTTLWVGVICLTLYLITLLAGINLIPVEEMARYTGDEMMRVSMVGYGIFHILFPVALITYLLSRKFQINLNYKPWLYYSGIVMIITMLITLTRRTQIDIIGTAIIITIIISIIFRTGKLSGVLKLLVPGLLVVVVLSFIMPKYVGFIADIGEDTFLLITTGRDSKGESDQRVSGSNDYKIVNEYISDNLILGTGYTYLYWKNGRAHSARGVKFAVASDAAGEVPIYYSLFGYGLIGATLILILYLIMFKLFLNLIRLLKMTFINYLQDPLILILSIYVIMSIVIKFSIKLYALSLDFNAPTMGATALLMGLGFALHRRLQTDSNLLIK
ncbi:MAG TPA: hypothetical protein DHV28_00960 [Ignavibacteriales bacterium]|nr:hypothetical protein [Ignavibacteriales bacterium]